MFDAWKMHVVLFAFYEKHLDSDVPSVKKKYIFRNINENLCRFESIQIRRLCRQNQDHCLDRRQLEATFLFSEG